MKTTARSTGKAVASPDGDDAEACPGRRYSTSACSQEYRRCQAPALRR